MTEILAAKLLNYMQDNNPDLLHHLQAEKSVKDYIDQKLSTIDNFLQDLLTEQKPSYIIEELCMQLLTADLRPSKYSYILNLLEEEFFTEYHHLLRSGTLMFEIINLIEASNHLFEAFAFSEETEDDKNLRYTITATIGEYFEDSEKGNSATWLTTPHIN